MRAFVCVPLFFFLLCVCGGQVSERESTGRERGVGNVTDIQTRGLTLLSFLYGSLENIHEKYTYTPRTLTHSPLSSLSSSLSFNLSIQWSGGGPA